jgi:hypothetical protein
VFASPNNGAAGDAVWHQALKLRAGAAEGAAVDTGRERKILEKRLRRRGRRRNQLRRRHNEGLNAAAANPNELGAAKKQEFVFHDRPAKRVSKLVAGEDAARKISRIVVIGVRGEFGKSVELINGAMKLVCARLGDKVDAAAGASVFGAKIIGFDPAESVISRRRRRRVRKGRICSADVLMNEKLKIWISAGQKN